MHPHPRQGRQAVLVVDDNRDAADSLALLLELEGYPATPVYSAQEAMERLDAGFGVDFVVSDVRMPGVDGLDFFRALRHRRQELRVILITGEDIAGERAPPGAIILRKPVTAAQVLEALTSIE